MRSGAGQKPELDALNSVSNGSSHARRERNRRVSALAAGQHGVVCLAQIRELGVSTAAIKHLRRTGRIRTLHPGVYEVGLPSADPRRRWLAGVLAIGDGACLSLHSAGALWAIRSEPSTRVDVAVTDRGGREKRLGIVLHWPRHLDERDLTTRHEIPVTTLARTLFDLAPLVGTRETQRMLEKAKVEHGFGLSELAVAYEAEPRRPNRAAMRRALATHQPGSNPARSWLERRLFAWLEDEALPLPVTNDQIGSDEADFHWPDLDLVVETDGGQHEFPWVIESDLAKDDRLRARGKTVFRLSHPQVTYRDESALAPIRRRLTGGRRGAAGRRGPARGRVSIASPP
jgi:very-short-patch-repair endonuclease/predicted transcriptional regulator of viral defense system